MNLWLLAAGCLSALVCLTHLVLGGREIARPLLDNRSLADVPRMTTYYCWHLVTIALALMAAGFLLSARHGAAPDAATLSLVFAAASGLLCLGMNLKLGLSHLQHPQWLLFLPVIATGLAGLSQ